MNLDVRTRPALGLCVVLFALWSCSDRARAATASEPVPPEQRGSIAAERMGTLSAGTIRTLYFNWGQIGDYPSDPMSVDLSVFHSLEAPRGSGMNYSDGLTPFLLAQIVRSTNDTVWVMETGYRERQAHDGHGNIIRLEPRPGFIQPDPLVNVTRSPAISTDPTTWPTYWPDRLDDPLDPGWPGHWNGFYGKDTAATEESYSVLDDQFYGPWPPFVPDARDTSRHGLALRFDIRTVQWGAGDARDILFLHYDITNEGTTPYHRNLVFGMYVDPSVGGANRSCDNRAESDDDDVAWMRTPESNLVHVWDRYGHGVGLAGNCVATGDMGWTLLQTPGAPVNSSDDDMDGLVDERQDSGAGVLIAGQAAIQTYAEAHMDLARFQARFGPLASRPAYASGVWWSGDEDMDWDRTSDDVGGDGLPGTLDAGEGDLIPTPGEPHFDASDLHEVDQLGLTGFKLNRIASPFIPGQGDAITFANVDGIDWPQRLFKSFTDPSEANRFDTRSALDWNIAFLLASGPFDLEAGQTVRFSVAIVYAPDASTLQQRVRLAQAIHDGDVRPELLAVDPSVGPRPPLGAACFNSPNPFRGRTNLRFTLAEPARARLRVFDLQGRTLATRDVGMLGAGEQSLPFDAKDLAPGLYLYRLELTGSGGAHERAVRSGRMVLVP